MTTEAIANLVRLQKILAEAGFGSRRHCEEYIVSGRVTVDGAEVRELGVRVDPTSQRILVDGEPIRSERKRYFLLNKPTGYLCTNRDPAGRPRVIDLFPDSGVRLFTVGRLDESSQGLLLVTNDGQLANRLAHPRFQVPKLYHVQVAGIPSQDSLRQLRRGIRFEEGTFRVHSVRRLKTRGQSAFLEVELRHGHNREIRRLFARLGHKVMSLQRVAFGPLRLGHLPVGTYRPLKPQELSQLWQVARTGGARDAPRTEGRRDKRKTPRTRKRTAREGL
jgi:23S rRNA pseudouridine2605 synthase